MRIVGMIMLLLFGVTGAQAGDPTSFEIFEGDTINLIDDIGQKQGPWIIFGRSKSNKGFAPEEKVEEGSYQNNRKVGLWKAYFPGEELKSEITYKNGRPAGEYKTYFQGSGGQLEEHGFWNRGRNVGEFKRWYPNGNLRQDFSFLDNGLRDGTQHYYHENGKLEVEVEISSGKENGVLSRYYSNGDLKERMSFNNGVIDKSSVESFVSTEPVVELEEKPINPEKTTQIIREDKPNPVVGFVTDGYNKLFNKNKQISQDGTFRRGKLYDGKWYRYDDDGILSHIELYKAGVYEGDVPITEDDD